MNSAETRPPTERQPRCRQGGLLLIAAIIVSPGSAAASSLASRNREGNRLFEQGKYQEAEKAYLEAQGEEPNTPELLYNLGNARLKQKKHKEAVQLLREAVSKGSRGLQANSWYNVGNALFEIGDFKNSADAYVQALRVNPADRDAKHNLELALRRLEEQQKQQQQSTGGNQDSPQPKERAADPKRQQDRPQDSQGEKREQPANPQATQAERREGSLSKERALQILDALQNQELEEQRKLLERRARRKATGRDW
jgi:tetratricopeptide (TPR) repeat protein